MKIVLLVICFFLSILSSAQTIQYSYDANGNRTQRKLYVCSGCEESGRQANTVEEKKKTEIEAKLGLSVFPNPAQDKINVNISNLKTEEEATLIMTDEQGRVVLTKQNGGQQNELDMSSYKGGVYFVKVIVGKETLFYKVIKL